MRCAIRKKPGAWPKTRDGSRGQYWTLEVDAEAREKMRAQEEARRQREEQERAREQAEKEALVKRQMELLKKAGRAPRCEYLYTNGRGCRAPQVRGERWCHGHARMMSYRPEKLELLPMEDKQAVTVNLYRVTKSLLSGRITEKVAGLALWSVAIAAPYVKRARKRKTHHGDTETGRKASRDSVRERMGNRVIARDPVIARDRKTKIHHGGTHPSKPKLGFPGTPGTETRRKTTKELPQINADRRRLTKRKKDETAYVHSGVTKAKSFKCGVRREGRALPEVPKVPNIANNENLDSSASHRLRGETNRSSASQSLRGEIRSQGAKRTEGQEVTALKSTKLHSHAQAGSGDGHL